MNLKGLLRKAYAGLGSVFGLTDVEPWKQVYGGSTYAGKSVTEVTAMQTSAVWTCVRILAESIGSLPWGVFEQDKKGNAQKVDHPLADVLVSSPNVDMTTVEYREAKVVNLALQGNGYSLIERRGDGAVSSLYPIPSSRVIPQRAPDGSIVYKVNERGAIETYPAEKIWHVKGFGSNGLMGYAPIGYMRQAVGLAMAVEEFGAKFFGQGATLAGVLKVPTFLTKEQRQTHRENIAGMFEGLGNAHRVVSLEGGFDFEPVTMPLEDAQFMLLRGFQIQDICRFYRIPLHLAGDLSRSTNNNIEQQFTEFVMVTLMPWLTRIEASANRRLLKPADRGRFFVRFNVDALLRGDSVARAGLYSVLLQNGVYTRNEVRALENKNASTDPGMDEFTVQSNMALINQIAELVAARMVPNLPKPGAAS